MVMSESYDLQVLCPFQDIQLPVWTPGRLAHNAAFGDQWEHSHPGRVAQQSYCTTGFWQRDHAP